MKLLALFVLPLALLVPSAGCGRQSRRSAAFDPSPSSGDASGRQGLAFVNLNLNAALSKARSERKLVMVDVYADWCGWCKKLDREVFSDVRVAGALRDVVPIRVDADRDESFAQRYGVSGLPTILFLDAAGKVVKRIDGYVEVADMLRIASRLPKPA